MNVKPVVASAVMFSCLALLSASSAPLHQDATGEESSSCQLMREVLGKVNNLKAGDLRAKVETDFKEDGGLQSFQETRYVWRHCSCIKIDVKFSGSGIEKGSLSPDDKIVSVSKPYLEYPVND